MFNARTWLAAAIIFTFALSMLTMHIVNEYRQYILPAIFLLVLAATHLAWLYWFGARKLQYLREIGASREAAHLITAIDHRETSSRLHLAE